LAATWQRLPDLQLRCREAEFTGQTITQSGTGIASGRDTVINGPIFNSQPDLVQGNVGILHPKVETIFSAQTGPGYRKLQIGDTGPILEFTGPNGMPLFQLWDDVNLLLETIDGQLKVSTKFRDRKGNLTAELVRNEWKVAPPPRTWDRNYSKDALEVKDETGRIVLQMKLLLDRVQLQGEWWKDEINGFGLFKANNNGGYITIFGPRFKRENAPMIEPLFVYPSDTHLGELRKP
jgi:hypothetical protein